MSLDFAKIENEMRIQLCTKLNRVCDETLNKLIEGLMNYTINIYSDVSHSRFGTLEVPNQYYYDIEYEFDDGFIDIKLYYLVNNTYRSYHKIHIKI